MRGGVYKLGQDDEEGQHSSPVSHSPRVPSLTVLASGPGCSGGRGGESLSLGLSPAADAASHRRRAFCARNSARLSLDRIRAAVGLASGTSGPPTGPTGQLTVSRLSAGAAVGSVAGRTADVATAAAAVRVGGTHGRSSAAGALYSARPTAREFLAGLLACPKREKKSY